MAGSSSKYNVLTNDLSRAWIFKDSVFKCNAPASYLACVGVDGLDQSFGEPTRIECPDPDQFGQFVEVGTFGAEVSRLTTSITGRFSRTEISTLYKLGNSGCAFDLQVHTGQCQRPTQRNEFDKILVFENVNITNWSTDPLVAMTSSDRGAVNETVDLSVGNFYEVVNLIYTIRGEVQTTDGPIVSTEFYDIRNCGSCALSDGCQKAFSVSEDGVAYFTTNGGTDWTRTLIQDTALVGITGNVVDAMAYDGKYIVLTDTGQLWYIDIDDWVDQFSTTWTNIASGLPGAGAALTSYGTFGLVVGAGGVVSRFINQDVGTVVVEDGTAAGFQDLNDVYTCGVVSVAVGDDTIIYSYNGVKWQATANLPAAGLNYTAVLTRSKNTWLVGTDDGQLWCTDNGGVSWSRVAYPGWLVPGTVVNDLQLSSNHVLWMGAGANLLRSIDGGNTWLLEPNTRTNTFAVTAVNSIATCLYDSNVVIASGTGLDGSGVFVTGGDPSAEVN